MRKKRIVVTGGAGFIGSSIVDELVRRGHAVTVLDDLSTGFVSNLRAVKSRFRFVRGDIREPKAVRRVLKGAEIVIHQAAIRSVPKSLDDPLLSHSVNATGTLVLLQESLRAGVKRFVYASTSAVYGNIKTFPQVETMPTKPISPYGVSKLAGENYCHAFWNNFGLSTVALRYFNVYGPRQNPESKYSAVVPAFIERIQSGMTPRVDGSGRQTRDFFFISDVVEANILAAFAGPRASGEAFNIAGGREHSVLDIVRGISKHLGHPVQPAFGPARKGDPVRSSADIRKAAKILGYKPSVSLDAGLRRTVEWFGKDAS